MASNEYFYSYENSHIVSMSVHILSFYQSVEMKVSLNISMSNMEFQSPRYLTPERYPRKGFDSVYVASAMSSWFALIRKLTLPNPTTSNISIGYYIGNYIYPSNKDLTLLVLWRRKKSSQAIWTIVIYSVSIVGCQWVQLAALKKIIKLTFYELPLIWKES